jgi:signal transduction histidine kinase
VTAAAGWALALLLGATVLVLRRRLELVVRAEHELRGPATVLALAAERMCGEAATRGHAHALEIELERLRAGLADLSAARRGRRSAGRTGVVELERLVGGSAAAWRAPLEGAGRKLRLDWRAGPVGVRADRGRLAQALGNLMANAAEHGHGPVDVSGRSAPGGVRVEIRSPASPPRPPDRRSGRGRGLAIAASAAASAGGRLTLESEGQATVAALELPAGRASPERFESPPEGAPPGPPGS